MGGGGQANKGQATTAANQQSAANQQDMTLAASNAAFQKAMQDKLFGISSGKPGSLTGMMDPASLNTGAPEGAYKTAWNTSQDQIGKDYANQKGSLAQSFANSGATSRSTPNGFQADQMNKLSRGEADTRGSTYTGIVGQQHQDALNNFWNANNVASGNAANSGQTATQAAGNSGNSSAQIYGTAGQYHPSSMGNVLGSAIGAGGAMGSAGITAAAQSCPASGSLILMFDRTLKKVEELKKGDQLMGIDGEADELLDDPMPSKPEDVLFIQTREFACTVSQTHTFVRPEGGYMFAGKSVGRPVSTIAGEQPILSTGIFPDKLVCWRLFLSRSHTYNVSGFWSLE